LDNQNWRDSLAGRVFCLGTKSGAAPSPTPARNFNAFKRLLTRPQHAIYSNPWFIVADKIWRIREDNPRGFSALKDSHLKGVIQIISTLRAFLAPD
jgi:hypothetical protein